MRGKTGADREISVNTYTGGFTTMLNHHLRNRNLSLKAVGLLSKMLSLPPDWDYSIRGLAMLNTDGIDGIRTAMKELEDEGYVVRVQSRDERGRMSRNKYTVYALPQKEKPSPDLPSSENPTTVKPPPDEPMTEKPTQINTNQVIPKKRNDSLSKYQSINPDGMDAMDERERYEEIIRENLEVDILSQDSRYDIDRVNEIIEVMLDAICSTSPTLRVNNADMPKEVVKSRLLKLNSSHIDYVFDAMRKSPSDIRNIRAYVDKYITNPPADYDVNPEYLNDEKFAALITEAEKYLGYPYVWGGSNPDTSFDCSGFVSYVLTNSGLVNTGRLGAQGLYNISTPVSKANAQPGDLIFFVGTYDTPGVSHVGIYVGDGVMIHCGDPIQYTSINSSYWQQHFYAFGRPAY